jgi:wobble nucleotide-excising tRNase
MYKKLIHIKNYGKFSNYCTKNSDWDGSLRKINVIYAPNGCGKTSLAELIRSTLGDPEIVTKKQTFGATQHPDIKFILDDNKELKFNGCWNRHLSNVDVFDSFYFEENLYTISINDDPEKPNIFEYAIFDEIETIKQSVLKLKASRELVAKKISNKKHYLRQYKIDAETNDKLQELLAERIQIEKQIKELEQERIRKTEEQRNKYVECINKYLALFCDTMKLTDIHLALNPQAKVQNLIYGIEINGHHITANQRSNRSTASLKYYLSDGDKNALALSFFLARMDMIPDLSSWVVVIDDPFTSFDTHRKMTTITQLSRLSKKVSQFFLLTHDLHFANDFNNACNDQILNLKIQNQSNSSTILRHDIRLEMLTGFNKDLMTLRRFVIGDIPEDAIYLREVIRCIRPSLEGIFRIKYFNYIQDTEWLGDFIQKIRDADSVSPFAKLKPYIDEIEEINDYSKRVSRLMEGLIRTQRG